MPLFTISVYYASEQELEIEAEDAVEAADMTNVMLNEDQNVMEILSVQIYDDQGRVYNDIGVLEYDSIDQDDEDEDEDEFDPGLVDLDPDEEDLDIYDSEDD